MAQTEMDKDSCLSPGHDAAPAEASSASAVESELWWSGILGRARTGALLVAVQVTGSSLAVAFSVIFAYLMHYSWPPSMRADALTGLGIVSGVVHLAFSPEFRPFVPFLLLSAVVFPLILQGLGLYRRTSGEIVPFGQAWTVAKGAGLGTLVLGAAGLLYANAQDNSPVEYSPFFLLYFAFLTLFGLLLFHSGTLIVVLLLQSFGLGLRRVALVYTESPPESLVRAMTAPSSQYRLLGAIRSTEGPADTRAGVPFLGTVEQMSTIINEYDLDEVVLAADPSALSTEQRLEVAQTCWRLGVVLKMVAPFYPFYHTSTMPEQMGGLSLLQVEKVGLYARWPQVLKRAMDIGVSLTALAVTSPIILLTILAIKLDSPGPAFFVQTRVGLNGRTFRMLKLRSMSNKADPKVHQEYLQKLIQQGQASEVDKDGKAVYKIVNDPRITRVGRFIRKTSIDELPQFINVLRGQMSLVGPRPPLPYEVAEYEGWHHRRLNIRPGITGLWQVSGRSRLTFEQMIRLDIDYIEHWSLWLDVKILLKTIPAVLKTAHSY